MKTVLMSTFTALLGLAQYAHANCLSAQQQCYSGCANDYVCVNNCTNIAMACAMNEMNAQLSGSSGSSGNTQASDDHEVSSTSSYSSDSYTPPPSQPRYQQPAPQNVYQQPSRNSSYGTTGGQNPWIETRPSSGTTSSQSGGNASGKYVSGGQFNHCVERFYDPAMHNWYSFRNNCSEAVSITYHGVNGGGGGAMDLSPGRKDSTGWGQDHVASLGGYSVAICPKGYRPVDAQDQYWNQRSTGYRCKASW